MHAEAWDRARTLDELLTWIPFVEPLPSGKHWKHFGLACLRRYCEEMKLGDLTIGLLDHVIEPSTNRRITQEQHGKAIELVRSTVSEPAIRPLFFTALQRAPSSGGGDWQKDMVGLAHVISEFLGIKESKSQAMLLRCIVGNPFRPLAFDQSWRSETAVALATGIYAERAFDRLPILADALEEAGCDHPDVLAHCRDPHQPHARGCWVVDLVLNKS